MSNTRSAIAKGMSAVLPLACALPAGEAAAQFVRDDPWTYETSASRQVLRYWDEHKMYGALSVPERTPPK